MPFKSIIISKVLLAIFTLIRFLFGVSSHMPFQRSIISKVLLAMFTLIRFKIRFLIYVSCDVLCKVGFMNKGLLTIFKLINFLLGASSDVPCKITGVSQSTLIKRSLLWNLLPDKFSVPPAHMYFKSIKTMKISCTKQTRKRSQNSSFHCSCFQFQLFGSLSVKT